MLGSIIETRRDQPVILHCLTTFDHGDVAAAIDVCFGVILGNAKKIDGIRTSPLDEPPEIAMRQQLRELTLQNKKGVA